MTQTKTITTAKTILDNAIKSGKGQNKFLKELTEEQKQAIICLIDDGYWLGYDDGYQSCEQENNLDF